MIDSMCFFSQYSVIIKQQQPTNQYLVRLTNARHRTREMCGLEIHKSKPDNETTEEDPIAGQEISK